MAQTSFQLYSDKWAVGQIADNSINQIDSFVANTVIPFGAPVMRSTISNALSEHRVDISTSITAGTCLGFAIRREMEVTGQYQIGDQIDVLRVGRIVVVLHTELASVKVNDLAYIYADSGIGNTAQNGLLVGRFVSNSRSETVNINGAPTVVNLAELQIDMLTNA